MCVAKCGEISSKSSAVDAEGVLTFSSERFLAALGVSKSAHVVGLRLVLDDPNITELPSIPYSLGFKYAVVTPVRAPKYTAPPVLELSIQMENGEEKRDPIEGEVVTLRATLKNVAKEGEKDAALPLVVSVIGIPGGFEPRVDQLRELKDSKIVDFVESKPGQVILYWRALKPNAVIDVPIQVVATIPGTYESPASRAYLFYNDEDKVWAKGSSVTIQPQKPTNRGDNLSW
jgi:hypothetical protein